MVPEAVTVIVAIFKKEKPLPPEDEPEGIRDAYVQILGLEQFYDVGKSHGKNMVEQWWTTHMDGLYHSFMVKLRGWFTN